MDIPYGTTLEERKAYHREYTKQWIKDHPKYHKEYQRDPDSVRIKRRKVNMPKVDEVPTKEKVNEWINECIIIGDNPSVLL